MVMVMGLILILILILVLVMVMLAVVMLMVMIMTTAMKGQAGFYQGCSQNYRRAILFSQLLTGLTSTPPPAPECIPGRLCGKDGGCVAAPFVPPASPAAQRPQG